MFSGHTSSGLEGPFHLVAGVHTFYGNYAGTDNFIIELMDGSGGKEITTLFNEIGTGDYKFKFSAPYTGDYYFNAKISDGPWLISVDTSPADAIKVVPSAAFSGYATPSPSTASNTSSTNSNLAAGTPQSLGSTTRTGGAPQDGVWKLTWNWPSSSPSTQTFTLNFKDTGRIFVNGQAPLTDIEGDGYWKNDGSVSFTGNCAYDYPAIKVDFHCDHISLTAVSSTHMTGVANYTFKDHYQTIPVDAVLSPIISAPPRPNARDQILQAGRTDPAQSAQ